MFYIIGKGRIGQALAGKADICVLLGRGFQSSFNFDSFDPSKDFFVFCTRNDSLISLINTIPAELHHRIVYIQNGMLSPFLEKRNSNYAARCILYFAVAAQGDQPKVGGDSLIEGPFANDVSVLFQINNIPTKQISKNEMLHIEMEKLIWNAVMGLLGQVHDESVEATQKHHWQEVEEIVQSFLPTINKQQNLNINYTKLIKSLWDYSSEVSFYEARIKEIPWRYQFFIELKQQHKLATPLWDKYTSKVL